VKDDGVPSSISSTETRVGQTTKSATSTGLKPDGTLKEIQNLGLPRCTHQPSDKELDKKPSPSAVSKQKGETGEREEEESGGFHEKRSGKEEAGGTTPAPAKKRRDHGGAEPDKNRKKGKREEEEAEPKAI